MIQYIIQGLLILACLNICHMGWVYFTKQAIKKQQGRVNDKQLQKMNSSIDEEISKIPEIEFCQVESDLEEFMKSIIQE